METESNTETCIFCGRDLETFPKMKYVASSIHGFGICFECNSKINELVASHLSTTQTKSNNEIKKFINQIKTYKPKEIKEKLDDYVIGQNNAKIALAVAIYNHYKKIKNNFNVKNNNSDDFLDKSNILMVGPTASGKCISGKTKIKLRNKKTGEVMTLTVDEFKKMSNFCD